MGLQSFFANFAQLTDTSNAIARLQELILQLAVAGKLVQQDVREESAFQLFARMQAEKARLGKQEGLKVTQEIPVAEEEAPYELPDGWLWSRLTNLGFINPRNNFDDGATASFVPMNLIPQKYRESVRTETRYWGEIKKGYTHFAEGDVVLAKITPCFQNGKAAVMRGLENKIGAGTTELHVFRPFDGFICPEYVLTYLKSPKFLLDGIPRMTGTAGQKRVPNDYFAQNPFPLPPLAEQRRIVAKVDELMRLCDDLEARQQAKRESRLRLNAAILAPLNKASSLTPEKFVEASKRLADNFDTLYDSIDTVSKLRATILQLGVQGKLVGQDPKDEPASVQLQKIQEERTLQKPERPRVALASLDSKTFPFQVPSGWRWIRLGELTQVIEYGTSEKASIEQNGVPVLRMSNIEGGKVLLSKLKYVSPAIKDLPRLYLTTNELLFNRTNSFELVGKTGIFKGDSQKFTFASYLIRLRLHEPFVLPDYVNLAMNADYFRATQISANVTQQCGQANFNGTKLANTLIPLPPLAEQQRIVAKVNQLMSLCDELEAKLRQAEADSEKLMNAIVKQVLNSVRDASETSEEVFA